MMYIEYRNTAGTCVVVEKVVEKVHQTRVSKRVRIKLNPNEIRMLNAMNAVIAITAASAVNPS